MSAEKNEITPTVEGAKSFAQRVADATTPLEQASLLTWLRMLTEIRDSGASNLDKVVAAGKATANVDNIWPVAKIVWSQIVHFGWEDRTLKGRMGVLASGAALAVFGFAGSGIAAFGGAIGVPLWVLFGTGGLAVGALIEEFSDVKEGPKK